MCLHCHKSEIFTTTQYASSVPSGLSCNEIVTSSYPKFQVHSHHLSEILATTGFVQVLEILESPGISGNHFPGLESPGVLMQVLESPGNLNLATVF